jgi:hypothetical protein
MAYFWAGFGDGKLMVELADNGFGGWGKNFHRAPTLFTSREEARRQFDDVRKVEVCIVNETK